MEVWGGTKPVSRSIELDGLNVWIYSKPYEEADGGGDIYFASTCATGRINRLLLADVCGHGRDVAGTARGLRSLMSRYVNHLDQTTFVKAMNRQFTADTPDGCFATAVVTTFFAPSSRLAICNAGHPAPLHYSAKGGAWSALRIDGCELDPPRNVPLGILELADYSQNEMKLMPGDLLLCYTDAFIEAHDLTGQVIGIDGLVRLIRQCDVSKPETLIDQLIAALCSIASNNLSRDDVTAMLMTPTLRRRATLPQRAAGIGKLIVAAVRGLLPHGERPPLPDLSLANVGGAVIPPLGKLHQGSRRRA